MKDVRLRLGVRGTTESDIGLKGPGWFSRLYGGMWQVWAKLV